MTASLHQFTRLSHQRQQSDNWTAVNLGRTDALLALAVELFCERDGRRTATLLASPTNSSLRDGASNNSGSCSQKFTHTNRQPGCGRLRPEQQQQQQQNERQAERTLAIIIAQASPSSTKRNISSSAAQHTTHSTQLHSTQHTHKTHKRTHTRHSNQ